MINMRKEIANEMVTKADILYRAMEDGDAYDDVQDFMDDVKDYLNAVINTLEGLGAAVEGIQYLDGRHKK